MQQNLHALHSNLDGKIDARNWSRRCWAAWARSVESPVGVKHPDDYSTVDVTLVFGVAGATCCHVTSRYRRSASDDDRPPTQEVTRRALESDDTYGVDGGRALPAVPILEMCRDSSSRTWDFTTLGFTH